MVSLTFDSILPNFELGNCPDNTSNCHIEILIHTHFMHVFKMLDTP